MRHRATLQGGFTLVELVVVMALVALLSSLALPRYVRSLEAGRETSLRSTLAVLRDAIDQFAADRGRYPDSLDELVGLRYLRAAPEDPILQRRDAWIGVPAPGDSHVQGTMSDVRSGAAGRASDGSLYADW